MKLNLTNDWVYGAVSQATSLKLLQILVPAGLDINQKEDQIGGYVAATASSGQMNLTRYLLEHEADPNCNPMADLDPALNMAVKGNFMEMAELLIQYGAKVRAKECIDYIEGVTALHQAAKVGHIDVVVFLVNHERTQT